MTRKDHAAGSILLQRIEKVFQTMDSLADWDGKHLMITLSTTSGEKCLTHLNFGEDGIGNESADNPRNVGMLIIDESRAYLRLYVDHLEKEFADL